MKKIKFFIFILMVDFLNGQNYVLNGDFEELGENPFVEIVRSDIKYDAFRNPDSTIYISSIANWYQISAAKTVESFDLKRFFEMPIMDDKIKNVIGCNTITKSLERNIVIGLSFTDEKFDRNREYIIGKISGNLEKGAKYKFGIKICQPNCNLKTGMNKIGVVFTEEMPNIYYSEPIYNAEALFLSWNKNIVDNWQSLEIEFIANGNEKYLTIGDFTAFDEKQIETRKDIKIPSNIKKKLKYYGQYLLIDSIYIKKSINLKFKLVLPGQTISDKNEILKKLFLNKNNTIEIVKNVNSEKFNYLEEYNLEIDRFINEIINMGCNYLILDKKNENQLTFDSNVYYKLYISID